VSGGQNGGLQPHSSFGSVPPAHFRATVATTASVSSSA